MELELIDKEVARIREELEKCSDTKRERIYQKIIAAALGTIPWVGSFISLMTGIKDGEDQAKKNVLYEQWLGEHNRKMDELSKAILDIVNRLNEFPDEINDRLESEEYLAIVRKGFRIWDTSDTIEKKDIVRKLMTNAGAHTIVQDDLIRLFLDWINSYHEVHFAIIRAVHESYGITRYEMWQQLNGKEVREDSMEADVFKLLIRDLSLGGVIRQHRAIDYSGNYLKKQAAQKSTSSNTYKSAFDNSEAYELTELGKQFVHYTMNELVSRVGTGENEGY